MTSGVLEPADFRDMDENLSAMANEPRRLIDQNPHVRLDIEAIKLNVRAPEHLRLVDHNPEARVEIVVGAINLNFSAPEHPPVTDQKSDGKVENDNKHLAHSLRKIDEDPEKKLFLKNWETERSNLNKKINSKSTNVITVKAALYQFIGLYSVFQGVILTAVAQSSALSCNISWAPGLLSLFASVVTLVSVYSKLHYYHDQKNIVHKWENGEEILRSKIDDFKVDGEIPDENNGDSADKKNRDNSKSEKKRRARQSLEMALTMATLAIFSLIVFASCFVILCPK
ncbi:unnamed protein product [Sphagnum balticum]